MGNETEAPPRDPYFLRDPSDLPSPSLVVFRELVRRNLRAMLAMAGGPDRLRPHVKTHKMPAMVRLVEAMGITRHKCATLAEAEMTARAGGRDVLIAYPMVGPNVARLVTLLERYPQTTFRATAETVSAARAFSEAMGRLPGRTLPMLVDLDVGMRRTGIDPSEAEDLYRLVASLPGLEPDGLHAYDGHIRNADPAERAAAAAPGVEAVFGLRDRLEASGLRVPRIVLGGTPTFPAHAAARRGPDVELSPGTAPFFDAGYGGKFPDLPFTPAAAVLTRVIRPPRGDSLTLDLGHKAIAADPAGDRLRLVELPGAKLGPQSEEHLVVTSPDARRFTEGDTLLAIPMHVCPTCALHDSAYVVEEGEVVDRWEVERGRAVSE